jgi:hypothetical protein
MAGSPTISIAYTVPSTGLPGESVGNPGVGLYFGLRIALKNTTVLRVYS